MAELDPVVLPQIIEEVLSQILNELLPRFVAADQVTSSLIEHSTGLVAVSAHLLDELSKFIQISVRLITIPVYHIRVLCYQHLFVLNPLVCFDFKFSVSAAVHLQNLVVEINLNTLIELFFVSKGELL